ncbi:MAG: hypothetical protein IPQ07_25335 [Myxococcales bacterium]|nr:hypothetical protein [Myxococcales bacterium]
MLAQETRLLIALADRPEPVVLEDLDVAAMSAVLALTTVSPVAHAELIARCDEAAVGLLVELGVLLRGTQAELATRLPAQAPVPNGPKPCKHITVALTGAVGVINAIHHVLAIADVLAETVDVVVSAGAREFIQPRLFEFYAFRVWTDPFEPAHGAAVPHVHLATTTDLVLVAPASASMLHKLATGACSDLVSLIVAATKAPVVIAPSMNPEMWTHAPIQRNVAQLRADGAWVIEPGLGYEVGQRNMIGVGPANFDVGSLMRALLAIVRHPR